MSPASRRAAIEPLREDYGLLQAVLDPYVNAVHVSLLRQRRPSEEAREYFLLLRERLLAEIQAEKDRLSTLVASIRDEVWFADTQKRFTLANPAALEQFGLDRHDAVDVEKFIANLERHKLSQASSLRVAVAGGGPAGALAAERLAAAGLDVILFDEKLAWEKPCGGGLTATALQVTNAMAALANGGVLMHPLVVKRVVDPPLEGHELPADHPWTRCLHGAALIIFIIQRNFLQILYIRGEQFQINMN